MCITIIYKAKKKNRSFDKKNFFYLNLGKLIIYM